MNVIIVGGGKAGAALAAMLIGAGHRVKVIEARPEHVASLRRELPPDALLHGSGTDPSVLELAGIHGAGAVVAVTGADEINLVVASLARSEFDVPRTIARVNHPKNAWLFTPEMGVDLALDQADLIARLIATDLEKPCTAE
jgi:trk system potassium uptake protein TrkA